MDLSNENHYKQTNKINRKLFLQEIFYRQKKKKYGARLSTEYTQSISSRAIEHVNLAGTIAIVNKQENRNKTLVGSLT
jgi:hypothetical protein